MSKLILYIRPSCPYCQKVLLFLKRENRTLTMRDIGDADALRDLIRIGGKQQVPCLLINGKALYESDDIIEWLKGHGDA